MAFTKQPGGSKDVPSISPEEGRLLLSLQQQMAAVAAQQQQASNLLSQSNLADARAATPRMQGGTATPQMSIPPAAPQQTLLNPYLFGVAAAAAQALPMNQYSALTGGTTPLMLAAAAAARNPFSATQPSMLLNPAAAQALALQQYAGAAANTANLAAGVGGISQTALALYYNQLLQNQPSLGMQSQQSQQQLIQQASPAAAMSPAAAAAAAAAGFRGQTPVATAMRNSVPTSTDLLSHSSVGRRQSAPIISDLQQHLVSQSVRGAAVLPTVPSHASLERTGSNGIGAKPKLSSPEAVKEHISRLISENEAILDPPPVLMKRRTYHRHASGSMQSNSSGESNPGMPGQESLEGLESPGRVPVSQTKAARSQSLIDPGEELQRQQLLSSFLSQQHRGGSLPVQGTVGITGTISGIQHRDEGVIGVAPIQGGSLGGTEVAVSNTTGGAKQVQCKFCGVVFPSERMLDAHVFRCNKKPENGSLHASQREVSCSSSAQISPTNTQPSSSPDEVAPAVSSSHKTPSLSSGTSSSRSTGTASPSVENKHPLKRRMLAEAQKMRSEEEEAERKTKLARLDTDAMDGENAALSLLQLKHQHDPPVVSVVVPKPVRPPIQGMVQAQSATPPQQIPASVRRQQFQKTRNQPPVNALTQPTLQHQQTYFLAPPVHNVLPQVTLNSSEKDQSFKPYCITVQVPGALSFEAPQSGRRPRHVTAPTFVCLKRPQPMFLCQKDSKLSMYKNWQQLPVNPSEAKLNLLLMGEAASEYIRSLKRGHSLSSFWKYSVASGDMGMLRMTHSSFWQMSKEMQASPKTQESSKHVWNTTTETKRAKKEISTQTVHRQKEKENVVSPGKSNVEKEIKEETTEKKVCQSSKSTKELLKGALANREQIQKKPKWKLVCNGGYSTDEGYTYVRGRGRGRYVCAACGIRCRKPSMLKKHIRTHQNVRPYSCDQCMFSFKTKGNLTKHLKSKAHSKKTRSKLDQEDGEEDSEMLSQSGSQSDSDEDRLEIDSNAGSEVETETGLSDFDEEEDDLTSDDESDFGWGPRNGHGPKRWHDKLLPLRTVHTPPASNVSVVAWRLAEERECLSAPPIVGEEVVVAEEEIEDSRNLTDEKALNLENSNKLLNRLNLPATVANLDAAGTSSETQPATSGAEISPFLKSTDVRPKCELCGKEFRKIGDLRLHMNVHYYEQSNKRYQYVCPVCNTTVRSKALLTKHVTTVHPNYPKLDTSIGSEPESSPVKLNPTSEAISELGACVGKLEPTVSDSVESKVLTEQGVKLVNLGSVTQRFGANNPRPFECTECGTAFRIHGHLAKHLRCKIHVMKLECQGKLPIGTYAKIEELGLNLNEVDTTDCETSLRSLQKIAERVIPNEIQQPVVAPPVVSVKNELKSPNDERKVVSGTSIASIPVQAKVSLVCTEEMRPSPPPHLIPQLKSSAELSKDGVSGNSDALTECVKQPPGQKTVLPVATTTVKSVVANVWCPPTQAEIVESSLVLPMGNGVRQKSEESSKSSMDRQDSEMSEKSSFDQTSFDEKSKSVDLPNGSSVDLAKTTEQQSARCKFCETEYPSEADLNVHLHADHILMRDGNDFKCPRANCDLVFPNKESLRQHIATHFLGGGPVSGSPAEQTERDGNVSCETMAALRGKLAGGSAPGSAQVIPGGTGGNTSPGTPEESQTSFAASGRSIPKKMKTHLVKLNSIPESTGVPSVNGAPMNNVNQEFKSPSSIDNSPMSDHSDAASRGSSSHSGSPVLHAIVGGPATFGRPLLKRKSVEELGSPLAPPNPPGPGPIKRLTSPDLGTRRCSSASLTPTFGNSAAPKRHPASSGNYLSLPSVPAQLKLASPGPAPGPQNSFQPLAWLTQGLPHQQAMFYGQKQLNGFGSPCSPINPFLSAFYSGLNGTLAPPQGQRVPTPSPRQSPADPPSGVAVNALNCAICQKECPNALALQEHILTHVCDRPHICEHCDAGFTSQQQLQAHLISHQEKVSG